MMPGKDIAGKRKNGTPLRERFLPGERIVPSEAFLKSEETYAFIPCIRTGRIGIQTEGSGMAEAGVEEAQRIKSCGKVQVHLLTSVIVRFIETDAEPVRDKERSRVRGAE